MKKNHSSHNSTFQIHITGIVQGVGFRPYVYNLALKNKLFGWVCNTSSGVYIRINDSEENVKLFVNDLIHNAPEKSKISAYSLENISPEEFSAFDIVRSFDGANDERTITPDFAMCEACAKELTNSANRRHNYPFITCSECGPRYSIIDKLPYDRENTRMTKFSMCPNCSKEYNDKDDRRFFSQTNSCPACGVKISLYNFDEGFIESDQSHLIKLAAEALRKGSIISIKGIGGYMLLADARNKEVIQKLRTRKNRPKKPFAVMVKDLLMANAVADLSPFEEDHFNSDIAPILLLKKKKSSIVAYNEIAPDLNEIGLLRPYSPLHQLIINELEFPLIATSANISGSPIIYKDDDIIDGMKGIADLILLHDREINAAQDDSVIRCTQDDQVIIIRRSRGLAPNVFDIKKESKEPILALGAMLKSTIGLIFKGNVFISQYIGNSNSYETQLSYLNTYHQLKQNLEFDPKIVLSDKHPGYFTHDLAEEIALEKKIKNIHIQHHEAHFCSVLGEYDLWDKSVLGVIWDGTGLGNDENIWGGEFFSYDHNTIERVEHLPYHKHILGDKMVNEPRIAAFSFFKHIEATLPLLRSKFSKQEWKVYTNLYESSALYTSSMGRLFDAVASILNINDISSFHGQAAMLLEAQALKHSKCYKLASYPIIDKNGKFHFHLLLESIVNDINEKIDIKEIAARFHHSLVDYIDCIAHTQSSKQIAFSGGVFQNKLLVELITQKLKNKYTLYFNHQFSPNDESISFGQLMHYLHIRSNKQAL